MTIEEKKKQLSDFARYSNIGFQMLAIILAGVFGGLYLDKWLELEFHIFTPVLSILSIFIALYHAIKDFLKKP